MKRQSQEKTLLEIDHDHIKPSYFQALRVAVLAAMAARMHKEDASDLKGSEVNVTKEDNSPTIGKRLKSASISISGIRTKSQKEKNRERAAKNARTQLAVLLLSTLCLLTSACGQVRRASLSGARLDQGLSHQAAPIIVDPIDESNRVVLPGNTRPEVRRRDFDRGSVDDSFPLNGMQLQLKRSPEREQAAEDLADDLERAGSPHFHQWLTAET
jgi:hypothetical protein